MAGREIIHGHNQRGKRTKTYQKWASMLERCYTPGQVSYRWYGGKGITVCKRWHKFENFLKDMGEAPEGLTLDRIDNDKNYCKGNCRWATVREQMVNRSSSIIIEIKGTRECVAWWARKIGLTPGAIYQQAKIHNISHLTAIKMRLKNGRQ